MHVQHRPPDLCPSRPTEHRQQAVDNEVTRSTRDIDRPRWLAGIGQVRVETKALYRGCGRQRRVPRGDVIHMTAEASREPDLRRIREVIAEECRQLGPRSVTA